MAQRPREEPVRITLEYADGLVDTFQLGRFQLAVTPRLEDRVNLTVAPKTVMDVEVTGTFDADAHEHRRGAPAAARRLALAVLHGDLEAAVLLADAVKDEWLEKVKEGNSD